MVVTPRLAPELPRAPSTASTISRAMPSRRVFASKVAAIVSWPHRSPAKSGCHAHDSSLASPANAVPPSPRRRRPNAGCTPSNRRFTSIANGTGSLPSKLPRAHSGGPVGTATGGGCGSDGGGEACLTGTVVVVVGAVVVVVGRVVVVVGRDVVVVGAAVVVGGGVVVVAGSVVVVVGGGVVGSIVEVVTAGRTSGAGAPGPYRRSTSVAAVMTAAAPATNTISRREIRGGLVTASVFGAVTSAPDGATVVAAASAARVSRSTASSRSPTSRALRNRSAARLARHLKTTASTAPRTEAGNSVIDGGCSRSRMRSSRLDPGGTTGR